MVRGALQRIVAESNVDGGNHAARNRALRNVRPVFAYAVDVLEILTKPPAAKIRELPQGEGDRVLDADEIRWFRHALDDSPIRPAARAAFRMLLLTGQRPSELGGHDLEAIEGDWWTIRETKNDDQQRVLVMPAVRAVIDAASAKSASTRYPFANAAGKPLDAKVLGDELRARRTRDTLKGERFAKAAGDGGAARAQPAPDIRRDGASAGRAAVRGGGGRLCGSGGPFPAPLPAVPGCTGPDRAWAARRSPGRRRRFADPDALEAACSAHFEWCEAHPLIEQVPIVYRGEVTMMMPVPKLRPFTLAGLCVHLGIGRSTWRGYRARPAFSPVCDWVADAIWVQQFEGAAAGLFDGRIVARMLGRLHKGRHKGREDRAGCPVNRAKCPAKEVSEEAVTNYDPSLNPASSSSMSHLAPSP